MKNIFVTVVLMSAIVFGSCQSTKQAQTNVINSIIEDHSTSVYDFPKGTYYAYRFKDDMAQDFDVLTLINELTKQKILVTDLWYKNGSNSCVPPGSEMAMQVIVEPVLFIRLEKPDAEVLKFGFGLSYQPDMADCAYRVKRYRF
jgi:hypothetical protein